MMNAKRSIQLRDRVLNAPRGVCLERPRFYTRSFKETEHEHPSLRAAKALDMTLRNMSIYILPEEQIVGNKSCDLVRAVLPIERGDITNELQLDEGMWDRYGLTEEQKKELFDDLMPYWNGSTVMELKADLLRKNNLLAAELTDVDLFEIRLPETMTNLIAEQIDKVELMLQLLSTETPYGITNILDPQGHLIVGHKNVLAKGFKGLKEDAVAARAALDPADERSAFLEAVCICCDAAQAFAGRFADLADETAAHEHDETRKKELETIAAVCRKVPFNPPETFREAIQAIWLTQTIAYISNGAGAIFAMGRVDQHLAPFFEKDRAEGRITKEEAQALIEELVVKSSYNLLPLFFLGKETASELGADEEVITLAGVTRDGSDATNELTYLFLDAVKTLNGLCSNVVVRVHKNAPDALLAKVAEVYSVTNDLKGLHNDDVIIPALASSGYPIEDARDYALIGCVEPASEGNSFPCTSSNDISLVAPLEMALKNGQLRSLGSTIGPETGDPTMFADFDALMHAYKKQLVHLIDFMVRCVELKDSVYAERFHNPLVSATIEGCIASGKDMTQGGARYDFSSISGRGLGTVADSLAAIKRCVFEEKTLSMSELIEALDADFEDSEDLRQMLLTKMPKYGNDDEYVDAIAREVMTFFCDEVSQRENTVRASRFRPGAFSFGMHVSDGWFLGATPDGRHAGMPVSNSLSPSIGAECSGPTATFKSVAKLDQTKITNGDSLNVKLFPALLKTEEGRQKFATLVKSYFALGGQEVQFNVVDEATLRAAQEHPEQYRNLVVRVSGYNAYFLDLGKSVQDDIIRRASFDGI